jgi:dihydrolipoamide dehydrogenase
VPNTENIGLEALGIATDRGHIDHRLRCAAPMCPAFWAIGDVTAPPWLAHKASHEGVIAAEAIAGRPSARDGPEEHSRLHLLPPAGRLVGLTEAKAKEAGYEVKVGNFPFIGNGKAIALGEAEGFIKTVFDAKTGELLGAHMVGAEVTELIQGYTIGKTAELVEADFMHTVFPHPTLSEMMHESVLGAYGKALHI